MEENIKRQKSQSHVDICGAYAAFLSLSEVGLGSLLHTLHLPFSGHFLSLNQIFLLSRASSLVGKNGSLLIPGSISFIAAALKSLSPAGKKLTPMLAITMQGLLYNLGILLHGHNMVGRATGAALSSVWGFVQPLLIYYLAFGKELFHIFVKIEASFRSWVPCDIPSVWYLCILVVLTKVGIAAGIALLAPRAHEKTMSLYSKNLLRAKLNQKPIIVEEKIKPNLSKVALLAVKDLCVIPFIACIVLSAISFFWAEGASYSWLIFAILRPIAVGFLFFFGIRLLPMEKVATWLEQSRFSQLGQAFRIALDRVKQL